MSVFQVIGNLFLEFHGNVQATPSADGIPGLTGNKFQKELRRHHIDFEGAARRVGYIAQ